MKFIEQPLRQGEYVATVQPKSTIVLHHTASYDAQGVDDWWNSDRQGAIATAYSINRDGTINRHFPDNMWAYHTGCGASVDKFNIGIEIANWGNLTKKGDKYYAWTGAEYKETVHEFAWRGNKYWAIYTNAQYVATKELVKELCKKYNIPREVVLSFKYSPSYFYFKGIISHHNVNSGKVDVSPAFPLYQLARELKK